MPPATFILQLWSTSQPPSSSRLLQSEFLRTPLPLSSSSLRRLAKVWIELPSRSTLCVFLLIASKGGAKLRRTLSAGVDRSRCLFRSGTRSSSGVPRHRCIDEEGLPDARQVRLPSTLPQIAIATDVATPLQVRHPSRSFSPCAGELRGFQQLVRSGTCCDLRCSGLPCVLVRGERQLGFGGRVSPNHFLCVDLRP